MIGLFDLALIFGARMLWQRRPNLWTCGLFWTVALASDVIGWSSAYSQLLIAAGILCNAAVTLANGGFMPVATHRRIDIGARSLWVQRQDSQRLLFLADNFGTKSFRFSVGDVLLLAGVILGSFGLSERTWFLGPPTATMEEWCGFMAGLRWK